MWVSFRHQADLKYWTDGVCRLLVFVTVLSECLKSLPFYMCLWKLLFCQLYLNWLRCLRCSALWNVPRWSPSVALYNANPCPRPQEAAKAAVLVLQSIFCGSEGVKVTPSPVRKAMQESKQEKPRVDCTYWTGKSGLNLRTEERENTEEVRSARTRRGPEIRSDIPELHLRFDHGPERDLSFPLYKLVNEVWSHAWGFQVQLKETVIVSQRPGSTQSKSMSHADVGPQPRSQIHQLGGQIWAGGQRAEVKRMLNSDISRLNKR